MGPAGVSYDAPAPQVRWRYLKRRSFSFGDTSLPSQKPETDSGPDTSARTSACSSQSEKPPAGKKQRLAVKLVDPGSHPNCVCCDAVAGLRNGMTPWGETPSRGKPRLVV